jgi:hypothetical protein
MKFTPRSHQRLSVFLVAGATLGLSACLGDGSGSESVVANPPVSTSITVAGTAGAGPIKGKVCAYALSTTGSVGTTALNCADTNATSGAFSMTIKDYIGDMLLKASGTYPDEATGQIKTIADADAIRSMVSCASNNASCTAAVTPLTETAIRTAGSLTKANIEAAMQKVAIAVGLNPANAAEAMAKLVGTVPDFTSRSDAAKTKYTDLLAVMSQAQATYCGSAATCTVEEHLKAIKTMLEGTPGANGLQNAINAATAAWNSNSHNTSGVKCNMASNLLSCTMTGSNAGTGTLDISVTASGAAANLPFPPITINNVPKPASQAEFCGTTTASEINEKFKGLGGAVKIVSCAFTGSEGTINVSVSISSPVPVAYAFTVTYKYR